MLTIEGYLKLLNAKDRKREPRILAWEQIYYEMSLHIDGIMPVYYSLRDGQTAIDYKTKNNKITPSNWGGEPYQQIFQQKLFSRHPRENEVTRNWRLSQYKPFTKDPFLQVMQVVTGAIFQDSGYSVTIEDKQDNDFIWGNNFDGKPLVQFLSDHFQYIAEDPNGRFVVIPDRPYFEPQEGRIVPKIIFIKSCDIEMVTPDEIIYRQDGYMWVVNKLVVLRYKKNEQGQYEHVDEAYGGYYAHLLNVVPAFVAGGLWNSQGFYDSWLDAAKPLADEYVGAVSAQQLVNKEASHPYIIEASADCPDCNGGQIQYCTFHECNAEECDCGAEDAAINYKLATCSTCGGSGEISRNPGQRLIVPPDMMKDDMVKLISPDVSINKFHAEHNESLYNSMLRALHLHFIEEAQSGTAKDKDMETRYQFIVRISNDLFDRLLEGFINIVTALRNVTSVNGSLQPTAGKYTIVKPAQFQIKTEADLLADYDASTKALMPDYVRAAQMASYVDKMYGGDQALKRKNELINQMDFLALKPQSEKSTMAMNGAAQLVDLQFSARLPIILDQLKRERGSSWFVNASFEDVKKEVDTIFAVLVPPAMQVAPAIEQTLNA